MAQYITHSNQPSSIFTDINSLDGIRKQAKTNTQEAIKSAAKEFEAFFMNMMLKSMRQASEVMGEDSFFGSEQEKMFIGMLDEQMSVELSQKGNLGIADLMARSMLGKSFNANETKTSEQINKTTRSHLYNTNNSGNNIKSNLTMTNDLDSINKKPDVLLSNNQKSLNILTSSVSPQNSEQVAEKKSLFDDAKQFINDLLPSAIKEAKKIGINPKLLLAQAALETGWGKYIMHDKNGQPSNNLFGIKANNEWQGDAVKVDTLEVEKGAFVKRKQPFRMYESFEKSFSDYVDFLQTNPRYQSALNVTKDVKEFVNSLQSAGYATDPNYAKKILNIFNREPLKNISLKAGE